MSVGYDYILLSILNDRLGGVSHEDFEIYILEGRRLLFGLPK